MYIYNFAEMRINSNIILIALSLKIQLITCLIDPITIGVGSAISVLAYNIFTYDRCIKNECCTPDWIPLRIDALEEDFKSDLHGQNVAATTIIRALHGYKNTYEPPKALVMSFHGLPGSGKNFVANMIAKRFFERGTDSEYYHFFNGRSYAPRASLLEYYQDSMRETIAESLLKCPKSLFVFDEVDMMPVGLLNVVVPFIDYTDRTGVNIHGLHRYVTTNKAVFIFLSNTGSQQIVEQMLKFWEKGRDRKDMKLADFENLIAIGAFNEKGGFQKSDTISTSLIDYYVPFMPLEENHVRLCMKDAFRYRAKPTKSMEEEVLSAVTWGPEPHNIYARSGCKKIEQKVISVAYQRDRNY